MPVALLSDIMIILIIVIITLMIYRDMKFWLLPIPSHVIAVALGTLIKIISLSQFACGIYSGCTILAVPAAKL